MEEPVPVAVPRMIGPLAVATVMAMNDPASADTANEVAPAGMVEFCGSVMRACSQHKKTSC